MTAYYNDNDPFCIDYLVSLIDDGVIPDGVVDDRSIESVEPSDLDGFTQCHFFAGQGGWPLAFRIAGWPDDEPVWSASCPCQPISSAGLRLGAADGRHLWPAFFRLFAERRPARCYGEQVAGDLGREWMSAVRLDVAHTGHACWSTDLPAAGIGAPHIRQRILWVAYPSEEGRQQVGAGTLANEAPHGRQPNGNHVVASDGENSSDRLGNAEGIRRDQELSVDGRGVAGSETAVGQQRSRNGRHADQRLADPERVRPGTRNGAAPVDQTDRGRPAGMGGNGHGLVDSDIEGQPQGIEASSSARQGHTPVTAGANGRMGDAQCEGLEGYRRDADGSDEPGWDPSGSFVGSAFATGVLIPCADGKYRPAPHPLTGIFPLAYGLPASMARLSAAQRRLAAMAGLDGASLKRAKSSRIGVVGSAGNAIVPELAAAFIVASLAK